MKMFRRTEDFNPSGELEYLFYHEESLKYSAMFVSYPIAPVEMPSLFSRAVVDWIGSDREIVFNPGVGTNWDDEISINVLNQYTGITQKNQNCWYVLNKEEKSTALSLLTICLSFVEYESMICSGDYERCVHFEDGVFFITANEWEAFRSLTSWFASRCRLSRIKPREDALLFQIQPHWYFRPST